MRLPPINLPGIKLGAVNIGPDWSLKALFTVDPANLVPSGERDLRLDFFRGLALFFIFLDHIPSNLVNWITIRNIGFSDAAEMFVFISGYAAALAYGGGMRRNGFRLATARILRRCWQLYVAHIFLFFIFTAQIAYISAHFNNPMFAEEMQVASFLQDPNNTLVPALLLMFRPANLDILPLYIVLLLAFPMILWGLERRPVVVLVISAFVYGFIQATHYDLPGYPEGDEWFFNPLAWQFLFILGALFGRVHGSAARVVPRWPALEWLAGIYLLAAFLLVLSWDIPQMAPPMPAWFISLIYPISKTDLDPLRLLHFLALAYLTVMLVSADTPFLRWRITRPAIRCGQQSLYVFCFGIMLSFSGHFFLVEYNDSFAMQVLVSAAGIALMIGLAYILTWYRQAERTAARDQSGKKRVAREA